MQPQNLFNAQNTEKSVSAIRAAEIFISTSSEEADGGYQTAKTFNNTKSLNKKFKCDHCN